ncbi:FecR family protein [Noviherbaspirillum sp.]|uniref:FecR family protein n=1 Tax=Noviherbaspirillum sp. TaxID=1926288 RepID=UPI002FE0B9E7
MLRRLIAIVGMLVTAGVAHAGEAGRIVFVAGQVQASSGPVAMGAAIQEGDEIKTGADGYVYLKTIDNGFLILRPSSHARIVAYHVDPQNPANTRVKLELLSGVARTISGQGVKDARQNFRFNTPVAAIGVRGTDFTVFTDQETSRVAVLSGGVVVSGFGGGCGPDGVGPCEGSTSLELFANQVGQLLQIRRGQQAPQLLPSKNLSPDLTAPPRSDEPTAGKSPAGSTVLTANALNLDVQKSADLNALVKPGSAPPITIPERPSSGPGAEPGPIVEAPSKIHWGRYAAILDLPASKDASKLVNATIAVNQSYYSIYREKGSEWQVPVNGSMGFSLRDSEAFIVDGPNSKVSAATIENARLQVDFGKASFATGFDLVHQNERFKMQAQGEVSKDGGLYGASQFTPGTNMLVEGVLSQENGGRAAYVFQSRIDANRLATGATFWGKQ